MSERSSGTPARPRLWLALAILIPNLITLSAGFIYDDVQVLVTDESLHTLDGIDDVWTESYWPDRPLLTLYRPVTKSFWVLLWTPGGGSPLPFHVCSLLLGLGVVLLVHQYLLDLGFPEKTAFLAGFLFALLPIHSEAIAPVFGMAELLAATFGLGALILHRRGHRVLALILFALAVFSKESAAALAGIAFLALPRPRRRYIADGLAAAAVIAAVLLMRALVSEGPGAIPAADNPASLQSPLWRIVTALWVQVLYLWKTIVPIHLAVEYSYAQIPLVVRFGDPRAWVGLAFVAISAWHAWKRTEYAPAVLTWWILFLPASNLLFPIGTIMAERLAYLPSTGVALAIAIWLTRRRLAKKKRWLVTLLVVVFVIYGGRTFHRNLIWTDTDRFYSALVDDAPNSARAHFGHGTYLAARGNDRAAVEAYGRSTEILPSYADAHFNRANALVRLGRTEDAISAYRQVERLAPGQTPAEQAIRILSAGGTIQTTRPTID